MALNGLICAEVPLRIYSLTGGKGLLPHPFRASGCVVEYWICSREVAGSNLAPRSTQPSIFPGSVNEYQL